MVLYLLIHYITNNVMLFLAAVRIHCLPETVHQPSCSPRKMYEQNAITEFEEKFHIKTKECELFVPVYRPYLGASPDAIVGDDGIVEVKCPYASRNMSILPEPKFRHLQLDSNNQIRLKKSSLIYDQIHGQLFLSNRKLCVFVVYTFKDLFVQKNYIEREYCIGCQIPKLELFYVKHFRPFVVSML